MADKAPPLQRMTSRGRVTVHALASPSYEAERPLNQVFGTCSART